MEDKTTKNNVKKPIFKKLWFWVIIIFAVSFIFGNKVNKEYQKTHNNTTMSQETSSSTFISEVNKVIAGAIGEDESITDVVLKNGDLCIMVDLSKANPEPLTIEDLAISRTGSITDAILNLTDYDSQWDTITVDFGDVGKITNSKENIEENKYGGRYFRSENFTLN